VKAIEALKEIYDAIVQDPRREKKVLMEVFRGGLTYQVVLDYSTVYRE
jgi:hypothetical protein